MKRSIYSILWGILLFLLLYADFAFSAEIAIKGIRPGMHIEHAREQAVVRMSDKVRISDVQGAPAAMFFTLDNNEGQVTANARERVECIVLSGRLVRKLFGTQPSQEHFARLLSAVWKIDEQLWEERAETSKKGGKIPIRTCMECYLPEEKISITICSGNSLKIVRIDHLKLKRRSKIK